MKKQLVTSSRRKLTLFEMINRERLIEIVMSSL